MISLQVGAWKFSRAKSTKESFLIFNDMGKELGHIATVVNILENGRTIGKQGKVSTHAIMVISMKASSLKVKSIGMERGPLSTGI